MRRTILFLALHRSFEVALLSGLIAAPAAAQDANAARHLCEAAGVSGGLCVLVGGADDRAPADLAATGRYLVHVLRPDAAAVRTMQAKLDAEGLYGLASVEQLDPGGRLPYTENLVNVLILGDAGAGRVTIAEAARVLCPGGLLFVADKSRGGAEINAAGLTDVRDLATLWRIARKPRPNTMDAWPQALHGADGNTVSRDQWVGPPRRVRWVAGPQQEVNNMVTAGGRSFFAGVLARDGFNGLRLWDRELHPSPARGGFHFESVPGSVTPIATADRLLVVNDRKLQALDAATGQTLREYPEAGLPLAILLEGNTILATDKAAIRAVDLQSGRLCWRQDAVEPRYVAAGERAVYFVQGKPTRLECRGLADGNLCWQQKDFAWLPKVRRCVVYEDLLVCEISTLADDGHGCAIRVLSAANGTLLWSREYIPGASHKKQARAMFAGGLLWVLEDKRVVGLDPRSGEVRKTHPARNTHCFPPVASTRYLFAGEMDLTDLETGRIDANQITKNSCGRDGGVVPANGLLYTFPKHCICWPMLRDYAALAPARPGGMPRWEDLRFVPEAGPARAPTQPDGDLCATASQKQCRERGKGTASAKQWHTAEVTRIMSHDTSQWPCYRHDALRSGSTACEVPRELKIAWTTALGGRPQGPIAEDWRSNYFIRGPVGPPVAAGGRVYVARPDAHQVVALDAATGRIAWTFTANGRVDTAPTIHRGLCLFGSKSGWVYCLRADDGRLVWRLRAAPLDERIVAYGQLESPWPVPGSVLVIDNVAYFAAGRHPLADGGILVFAVDPACGQVRWVERLDRVPQTEFYGSSGLEFEAFDLLHREGEAVAMSRWLFDRTSGAMSCSAKSGFARLATGADGVLFPRGCWSYAPLNEAERWKERPFVRPLAVFRGSSLYSGSQDRRTVFRRDFHPESGEKFDTDWFAGWETYQRAGKGGDLWRSQRLARGAAWSVTPFLNSPVKQPVSAMILAGDALYVAGAGGRLAVLDAQTGGTLGELETPPPAWDGLAAAEGRLFLSTEDGRLVCFAAAGK